MKLDLFQICVIFAASILAGAVNSVAGGGSFITVPTLISTGMSERFASATNTIGLVPGTAASVGAYRVELMKTDRTILIPLSVASIVGGVLGAILLDRTPDVTFKKLLPFLMLIATLLFTFGSPLVARIKRIRAARRTAPVNPDPKLSPLVIIALLALQTITAIYGGFFGGGIGIIMLASLQLMGMENIHEMNALKTLLATIINGAAAITLIVSNLVLWPQAILMIVGSTLGGYGGAYYARKLNPRLVRAIVMTIGFTVTAIFFLRA